MRAKLGRRGRCPEGGCSAAPTVLQPVSPSLTWKRRPRATCVAVAEHASAHLSFMRAGRCRGGGLCVLASMCCKQTHRLGCGVRDASTPPPSQLPAVCRYATVGRGERSDSTLLAWDAGGRGLSRRRQDQRCIRARTLLTTAQGRSGAAPNRCEQPARLACRAQRSLCPGSRQPEDSHLCSFHSGAGTRQRTCEPFHLKIHGFT